MFLCTTWFVTPLPHGKWTVAWNLDSCAALKADKRPCLVLYDGTRLLFFCWYMPGASQLDSGQNWCCLSLAKSLVASRKYGCLWQGLPRCDAERKNEASFCDAGVYPGPESHIKKQQGRLSASSTGCITWCCKFWGQFPVQSGLTYKRWIWDQINPFVKLVAPPTLAKVWGNWPLLSPLTRINSGGLSGSRLCHWVNCDMGRGQSTITVMTGLWL